MRGDEGDDRVAGRGGQDSLYGEEGDDLLIGGANPNGSPDSGDGGPNDSDTPGDRCVKVEEPANCETLGRD